MATIAIHRNDAYARQCEAVVTRITEEGVELDRTVFYPLGGGQAGDRGELRLADGSVLPVVDARKSRRGESTPDDTLHVLDPASGWQEKLSIGTAVAAQIDTGTGAGGTCACTRLHTCCARWCANWSTAAASPRTTRDWTSR